MSEFNPLDQQYLPAEHVRKETINMLANLELEIHRLRMHGTLAGTEDVQAPSAAPGVTIAKAIENLQGSIDAITEKFGAALADAGTQQ